MDYNFDRRPEEKSRHRNVLTVLWRALLGPVPLSLTALLCACGSGTRPVAPAATAVRTAIAVLGSSAPVLNLPGVVGKRETMKLSFNSGGVISDILVDAGDAVRQGQTLAQIEPSGVDAQTDEAQESDIVIVAPVDGVILARVVDAHEPIAAGQPVLIFGSLDKPQTVRAALTDGERHQVRAGDRATATFDALPGVSITGIVRTVAAAADATTGLFPIQVELQRNSAALTTGMAAHLSITSDHGAQRVHVPLDAIVGRDGTRAWLFVAQEGVAHRREVELAFADNTEIAIASGLYAGETVVVSGAANLQDGQKILAVLATSDAN